MCVTKILESYYFLSN